MVGFLATKLLGSAPKKTDIVGAHSDFGYVPIRHAEREARLAKLRVDPMPMSAPEFGKYIVGETEKWANVIKFAGIKPE